MRLASVAARGVGPLRDVAIPCVDEAGVARRLLLVQGGGGVGKSTLLQAIAATRPGHATVLRAVAAVDEPEVDPTAVCAWQLGMDDSERPHPLVVASPGARVYADEARELGRRREQALFDKAAQGGGFAFLLVPSSRWFARQPLALSAPARTIARYDVRASGASDDLSRADLGRETKQALAYADLTHALAARGAPTLHRFEALGLGMRGAVGELARLAGLDYVGCDAASFEPLFRNGEGRLLPFDALPTRARHLVAFAALSVRVLWGAYPGLDPRAAEGVVAIDDVDLHQDAATLAALPEALQRALPRVQWLLTASAPGLAAACDPEEVVALRRLPHQDDVEVFCGGGAVTH